MYYHHKTALHTSLSDNALIVVISLFLKALVTSKFRSVLNLLNFVPIPTNQLEFNESSTPLNNRFSTFSSLLFRGVLNSMTFDK